MRDNIKNDDSLMGYLQIVGGEYFRLTINEQGSFL